jgi:DNA repair photolyase
MPIIPYITDNEENFEKMFASAAECDVHYVLPGTLYLRGTTYKNFMAFIEREFGEIESEFKKLYKTGSAGNEYKTVLYERVNRLRDKYGLSKSYSKPMKEKLRYY